MSWEMENHKETTNFSEWACGWSTPGSLLVHSCKTWLRVHLSLEPEAIGGCNGQPAWVEAARSSLKMTFG